MWNSSNMTVKVNTFVLHHQSGIYTILCINLYYYNIDIFNHNLKDFLNRLICLAVEIIYEMKID